MFHDLVRHFSKYKNTLEKTNIFSCTLCLMIFTYQIVPVVLTVLTFRCLNHERFSFTIARPENAVDIETAD